MKKLLTITLLCLIVRTGLGQAVPDIIRTPATPATGANANNRSTVDANLYASKNLRIPRGSSFSLNGAKDSIGYVMFNTTSNRFGVYIGSGNWQTYLIASDIPVGVSSVVGITNRTTVSPTTGNVVVDISPNYPGQTSITTLGTIVNGSIPYSLLSGTVPIWNQNTTGNAATVTNGVYTTTFNSLGDARYPLLSGAYANPSWITSLPYSKITGTPSSLPTPNSIVFNNTGTGAASGTSFDGSVTRTISYNTIGAQPAGSYSPTFTVTTPITYSSNIIGITQSTTSTNGYLTSTDWNIFNAKQTALFGTGLVRQNGSSTTYDNTDYLPKSGGTLTGDVQQTIAPVNGNSLITKSYVDNALNGLSWKQEVRVATTTNITLSNTQTVDGIGLSVNDRVLVKNQTTQANNGIYLVSSGAWVRTTDADSPSEFLSATVLIRAGTLNQNTQWTCTNVTGPVIGTDPIAFAKIAGPGTYTNGTGITLASNVFSLDLTYTDARYGQLNNPLSQFAATTSAQLRGVLSDETGTGLAYFQDGDLGTPSAGVATNLTGSALGLNAGTVTSIGNLTGDVTSVNRVTTLATVNSNVGSFSNAANTLGITVNAKGLITAAATIPIQIAQSQVTGLTTSLAGYLPLTAGTGNKLSSPLYINSLGSGVILENSAVSKGYFGLATSAGNYVVGSAVNDVIIRGDGNGVGITANSGASYNLYINSSGNSTFSGSVTATHLFATTTNPQVVLTDAANSNYQLTLQNTGGRIRIVSPTTEIFSIVGSSGNGTFLGSVTSTAFVTSGGTSSQYVKGDGTLGTYSGFSNPMTTLGDIIYGGSSGTPTRLGIGGANTVLHGGTTPSYSAIVQGDVTNGFVDASTAQTGLSGAKTWEAGHVFKVGLGSGSIGTVGSYAFNNGANGISVLQSASGVTAGQFWTLPNKTGTVALTSDTQITGQAALTAGVATITIPGLTTSSIATTGFVSIGGTVSTTWQYKAVCTTNTLTITAITNANTTNTTDTSILNYSVKL